MPLSSVQRTMTKAKVVSCAIRPLILNPRQEKKCRRTVLDVDEFHDTSFKLKR